MKKVLLFAILILSINSIAQNKQPRFNLQHPISILMDNVKTGMDDRDFKTTRINTEWNLTQTINNVTPGQHSSIQEIDSIYIWKFDSISDEWKIIYKYIDIVYDANNNLISELGQRWNGSSWMNSLLTTYSFDKNKNQTGITYLDWNGNTWINSYKITETFDENNNLRASLSQYGQVNDWVNYNQVTCSYNANNKITEYLYKSWRDNAWMNSRIETISYDANSTEISKIEQLWNGYEWMKYSLATYTCDANNNRINSLFQEWNGNNWVNYAQSIDTYDANHNLIIELGQRWYSSNWFNSSQRFRNYDADNNLVNELYQTWNGSTWSSNYENTNTYDANNFKINFLQKKWNSDGTGIVSIDSTHNYYHTISTEINDLIQGDITIYPNPNSGRFIISSSRIINSIEIYNLSGERIYTDYNFNKNETKSINLTNVSKGIYFVKFDTGTKFYSRKLVIN